MTRSRLTALLAVYTGFDNVIMFELNSVINELLVGHLKGLFTPKCKFCHLLLTSCWSNPVKTFVHLQNTN